MYQLRRCPVCGKKFIPKTYRHIHCHRKCFKKEYRMKIKALGKPSFNCPKCNITQKLDFCPKSSFFKWKKYKCPNCGYSMFKS